MPSPGTLLMFLAMAVPVLAAGLAALGFRGRELLLGLDLGTTFSSIALRRPGGIAVAAGAQGRLGTPSVVALSAAGAWVVGGAAEAVMAAHPARGALDAKRVIGRRLEDPMCVSEGARHGGRLVQHPTARRVRATGMAVRTAKQRAHCASASDACWLDVAFALEVPPGLSAQAVAQLAGHACVDQGSLVEGGSGSGSTQQHQLQLLLTPQAAACLVVQDLLAAADRALGYSGARKAMAATPTDFDAAQRSATMEALQRAGLSVSRLLHEPTAAAIAYGLHKDPAVHTVLVYDFGGGTLDVSILFAAQGSFTVIGTAGDNALGGEDVDDCLVRLMQQGSSSGEAGACDALALSAEAERVKKALSGNGGEGAAAEVAWACQGSSGSGSAAGVVTGAAFEQACGELFERALAPVREALLGASLRVDEIDEVVLVGGSTRLPAVRARLQAFFGGKALRTSVDPDLAVAIGAAASGD
jgi:molecular chaperone DnaK (HSP70)